MEKLNKFCACRGDRQQCRKALGERRNVVGLDVALHLRRVHSESVVHSVHTLLRAVEARGASAADTLSIV